jgi:hypothetical protein
MIIYNVFIPFYPKKINKNTLWSLNFSTIWAEVPHQFRFLIGVPEGAFY